MAMNPKSDAPNPSIGTLVEAHLRVQRAAENLSAKFQSTPGEDSYEFMGSMNDVEDLRSALSDLQWYGYDPNNAGDPVITHYKARQCPCGHGACKNWFVHPPAATQGVGFTEQQAKEVAAYLDNLEHRGIRGRY